MHSDEVIYVIVALLGLGGVVPTTCAVNHII